MVWPASSGVADRAEKPFEEKDLARPGGENDLAGNLPGGVTQREGDDHDVVEGADDRQELGDQADRAGDPQAGDEDRDPSLGAVLAGRIAAAVRWSRSPG
jgi:hypothetical protein